MLYAVEGNGVSMRRAEDSAALARLSSPSSVPIWWQPARFCRSAIELSAKQMLLEPFASRRARSIKTIEIGVEVAAF